MTLMRLHRCTFSSRPSLFVFVINTTCQCSDAPEHACSLARAFISLAHAQNGRTYGICFQSLLRRDLVCMQSCQSLHCSRTYTQWVYTWHLSSVNAQTSLSMRAVSPGPSLLSHMHKMGVHTAYAFSRYSDET